MKQTRKRLLFHISLLGHIQFFGGDCMKNIILVLKESHVPERSFPSWTVTAWLLKKLYP